MTAQPKKNKTSSLALIGVLLGICFFLAAFVRADIADFFSRLPRDEFGACAVGAIVVLTLFVLGALFVFGLSKFRSKTMSGLRESAPKFDPPK